MNPLPFQPSNLLMRAAPEPGHALGEVADDWEAADVWLRAVARKSSNGSASTLDTYGFHLAKLRWYCENVAFITPSRWSMQEVEAFHAFLENLPDHALCAIDGKRFVSPAEPGYTPFRKKPSKSSRADLCRFVHALFKAWHSMGYLRINPMALTGALGGRKVKAERSIDETMIDAVFMSIRESQVDTFVQRQRQVRDFFVFTALTELGLRASELVGARMGDFYQLSDPITLRRYWIFVVSEQNAKGGKMRRVPATRNVIDALAAYRQAFGLPATPAPGDGTALILSPRTHAVTIAGKPVKQANARRFFGAWRSVTTRQGLYKLVKERVAAAADMLESRGHDDRAEQLNRASPHWLRHTFAKASLLKGQSMREVASLLGHASIDTTMIYTEQDALDLIRALERTAPECVAVELPAAGNPPRAPSLSTGLMTE